MAQGTERMAEAVTAGAGGRISRAVGWVVVGLAGLAAAGDTPLGHKDFYPSDERPIGFRGDGNGAFPGATPVKEWREGDVSDKEMKVFCWGDAGGNTRKWELNRKVPVFTNNKWVNIVWKTEMPGFSESSPIVVGDRVFCMADPFTLVCVDVHTGKILWQKDLNPFALLGLPKEEVERLTEIMEITQAVHSIRGHLVGNYGRLIYPFKGFTEDLREPWLTQVSALVPLAEKAQRLNAEGADKVLQDAKDVLEAIRALQPGDTQDSQPNLKKLGAMHLLLEHPLRRKYGFYVCDHWAGMVNHEFATPVSDGKRVYVSCGMGQVACFDLDGNIVWAQHVKVDGMEKGKWRDFSRCAQCLSPLLIGDLLVAQQILKLMAFNKKTGELVWENPDVWNRYCFNMATHKHVRTTRDGKPADLIVTSMGVVLDASTGKEVARLVPSGTKGLNDVTPAVMAEGDRVYFGNSTFYRCYRLAWSAEGKWAAEEDIDYTGLKPGGTSLILWQGQVTGGARLVLYDPLGKSLVPKTGWRCDYDGLGPILAGKYVVGIGSGGIDSYCRLREDDEVMTAIIVADVSDPAQVTFQKNWIGGLNKPHVRHLERQAPAYYAQGWQVNLADRRKAPWSMEAVPPQFGYASPAAQGNRLFIRGLSHLYCIGDPQVPYDGPRRGNRTAE